MIGPTTIKFQLNRTNIMKGVTEPIKKNNIDNKK